MTTVIIYGRDSQKWNVYSIYGEHLGSFSTSEKATDAFPMATVCTDGYDPLLALSIRMHKEELALAWITNVSHREHFDRRFGSDFANDLISMIENDDIELAHRLVKIVAPTAAVWIDENQPEKGIRICYWNGDARGNIVYYNNPKVSSCILNCGISAYDALVEREYD